MAKDKTKELLYQKEKLLRTVIRKQKRKVKRRNHKDLMSRFKCRGCGEDPYCYCGDGTPYSY
jgi:hypothetical protein